MVEFIVTNEIFLGAVAIIAIPLAIFANKLMNKISNLITCFQQSQKVMETHLKDSEIQKDKLNQLHEKSALHSLLIQHIEEYIDSQKKSPI